MAFDVTQAIIDRLRATKRENIERVIAYNGTKWILHSQLW